MLALRNANINWVFTFYFIETFMWQTHIIPMFNFGEYMHFMEAKRLVDWGRSRRLVQITTSSLFRFVLNICDDFLAHRNILATNQIMRRTIKPFESNNKWSQGHLGEGGPSPKNCWSYYQHSFHELTSTNSQSWLLELAPTRMNGIPKWPPQLINK